MGSNQISGRPALLAMIPAMLLALLYGVVRFVLDLVVVQHQKAEAANLRIEVLALRHQLRVLDRQVRRLRFQAGDGPLVAVLSRILPTAAWSAFLVCPEALLDWHRELPDHLLIFGQRHLEHVLGEFIEHYHEERPHQGLEQRVPRPREPIGAIAERGPVLCRTGWVALCTDTSVRLLELPIAFVERHTLCARLAASRARM